LTARLYLVVIFIFNKNNKINFKNMTNINNNNLPPIEEIRELKNEIPSFEEFMKTYQADENLNYADLNSGDISEVKGYGPCSSPLCSYSSSFYTKIRLETTSGETKTYFRAAYPFYAVYYGGSSQ
jgi:hypothetical protein